MIKLLVGSTLLLFLVVGVKMFALPFLPQLSVEEIRNLSITDLIKLFEAAILILILAGFVLQEFLRALHELLRHPTRHAEGARWTDLLYVLVAALGSVTLFAATSYIISRA